MNLVMGLYMNMTDVTCNVKTNSVRIRLSVRFPDSKTCKILKKLVLCKVQG